MANYGDMIGRIADELDRADLTVTEIPQGIQSAIGFYERKYFYFTSGPQSFTFSTAIGREYYTSSDNAAIATSPNIYRINGTFFGLRRPLHKQQWEYIDNISTIPQSKAMPVDWAYNGEQIRLYPIPDNVYVLTCASTGRPVRPSANSDAGVWMNDAEALIRTKAKLYLQLNVIRASDMEAEVMMMKQQEKDEFAALAEETRSREATGVVSPSRF